MYSEGCSSLFSVTSAFPERPEWSSGVFDMRKFGGAFPAGSSDGHMQTHFLYFGGRLKDEYMSTTIIVDTCHHTFVKPTDCIPSRGHPNVKPGLLVMTVCQERLGRW